MNTKNTKGKTSKATSEPKEDKLKAKLKENHKKFLKEEFEEEEDFGDDLGMDAGLEGDAEGFGDEVGGDDSFGDDEDFNFDDEGGLETELTPEQDEFVDTQVDELLDPASSILSSQDEGDDLSLTEADEDFDFDAEGGDEDFDFDAEGGEDVDLEASGEELEGEVEGGIPTQLDSTFSADELQSIIDNPNTIDALDSELTSTAVEEVPGGGGTGSELGVEEEPALGSLEESLLIEAELAQEIKAEMRKLRESEVASTVKSLDFTEESKPETEDSFAKVSDNAKGGPSKGEQKHKSASLKDMKQEIKEDATKKSAMIVKLAKQVLALQKKEASYKKKERELQLENHKLIRANGLLAAAGEKLDAQSRTKIVESFQKCKDEAQVNTLYKKIVNVIKEKARGSINEAVQGRRTSSVKTFNRMGKDEGQISETQQRANLLMGLPGSDEAYFSQF